MKVLKLTTEQLHDVVLSALAQAAKELTGKDWDVVLGLVVRAAEELNQRNHLQWEKELDDATRVEDAAWKLLPYMGEMSHDELVKRLRTFISGGGNVTPNVERHDSAIHGTEASGWNQGNDRSV